MARHLLDSEFIFGIHEPGGESHMLGLERPGWIVFTEGIGASATDMSGRDYRPWSDKGLGVIVRLNNGYSPAGTIPGEAQYADFAARCANFVANSPGCKIWIIGNEMNFAVERPPASSPTFEKPTQPTSPLQPGKPVTPQPPTTPTTPTTPSNGGPGGWLNWFKRTLRPNDSAAPPDPTDPLSHGLPSRFNVIHDPASAAPKPLPPDVDAVSADAAMLSDGGGEVITPEMYARCYKLCRDRIQTVQGHGTDKVLVGAVAPWNNQTRYPGNENGDWVKYFKDTLVAIGPDRCDGFTLHTYTHGQDANLVTSEDKMAPPFDNRYYHFRAYQDFMRAVPSNMRHLPVYLTETDQDEEWLDRNIAWVQRAYGEINWWNRQTGNQQIHCCILYRWPRIDKWYIEGKQGVIDDFREAMKETYKWERKPAPPLVVAVGDQVRTKDWLNLRAVPAGTVVAQTPARALAKIINGAATLAEGVYWWTVEAPTMDGTMQKGWLAQESPMGLTLLERVATNTVTPPVTPPTPPSDAPLVIGGRARTLDYVRLRKEPGISGKPADDVLAEIPAGVEFDVIDGPASVDSLRWWYLRSVEDAADAPTGWMAESSPNGIRLLEALPGGDDDDHDDPGTPVNPGQPGEPDEGDDGDGELPTTPPPFTVGDRIITVNFVRFRKTPGTLSKPVDDVIAELPPNLLGIVRGGPQNLDNMRWWQIEMPVGGIQRTGWAGDEAPNGIKLLDKAPATITPPAATFNFKVGDLVLARTAVNVRKSAGMLGKPADDLLGYFEARCTLNLVDGPTEADGVRWWRVGGITLARGEVIGWVAEKLVDGTLLIGPPACLPGTEIPNAEKKMYLHAPFIGTFGISQLWGENPQVYSRFTYDGVSLKGHNGIDFLTPTGTPLAAVDAGVVADAIYADPGGFGNYIKLVHRWGESLYAHMDTLAVTKGQEVEKGQVMGTSGNTGFSGGPHLHFAIRITPIVRTDGWGGFSDPLPYMQPEDVHLPAYVLRDVGPADTVSPEPAPHDFAPGMGPEIPGVKRP
jgi:hypothetical protein